MKTRLSIVLAMSCVESHEKKVFRIDTAVRDGPKPLVPEKDCHLKVLDQCLNKAYYLTHRYNQTDLTSDKKDFDDMCRAVIKVINCMDNYFERCSYTVHKDLYQFGKQQFYQSWKQMCFAGPVRDNYVKHSTCIQRATTDSEEYQSVCVSKLQLAFDIIKSSSNILDMVNTGCCAFNGWHSCIDRLIEQKCGSGGRQAIHSLIEKASAGTVYKLCPKDYFSPESNMCNNILE